MDSGRTCSTVLTFEGLVGDLGEMASTRVLSKVQEVESLRSWISGVKGSADERPHNVPEQPVARLGPLVAPPGPGVVTTGPEVIAPMVVVTGIAVGPEEHCTLEAQSHAVRAWFHKSPAWHVISIGFPCAHW